MKGKDLSIIIPNHKERRLMEVYAMCQTLFPEAEIILQDDLESRGKGWAMREGSEKATRKYLCFIDGDMDIDVREVSYLLDHIEDYDIVLGKRIYLASLPRKICSLGYKLLVRLLFGLFVDTQTGLKVFNRYALPEWEADNYAFDIEILLKAKKQGFTIKEVPIKCKIQGSKTPQSFVKSIYETFKETIKIWINEKKGLYDVG